MSFVGAIREFLTTKPEEFDPRKILVTFFGTNPSSSFSRSPPIRGDEDNALQGALKTALPIRFERKGWPDRS